MHRIDGGNLAAVHEGVRKRGPFVTRRNLRILVSARQVDTGLQPLHRCEVDRYAGRQTVETGVAHVAVLAEIAQREVIVALLVGRIAAEKVFLAVTVADGRLVPVEVVGIAGQHLYARSQTAVGIEQILVGLVEDVQIELLADEVLAGIACCHVGSVAGRDAGVAQVLPAGLHELARVGAGIFLDAARVDALVHLEVEAQFAGRTFLGGDEDDTVRSTVAVEGARSGILQHRQALDVGRIDVGDASAEGYAVHHIKGRTGAVHRADTADADIGSTARSSIRVVDLYARSAALQGGSDARRGSQLNLRLVYR